MKKWQDIFEPEFKLGFGAQIGIRLKDREEFRKIIDFVGKSMFGDVVFVGNFRIPKTEIIDCLNGKVDKGIGNGLKWYMKDDDPCHIYLGDTLCLRMRGWGFLTGVGSLNLPCEESKAIQDSLRDWIVDRLNGL